MATIANATSVLAQNDLTGAISAAGLSIFRNLSFSADGSVSALTKAATLSTYNAQLLAVCQAEVDTLATQFNAFKAEYGGMLLNNFGISV